MKIFILIQHLNNNLETQAELLKTELEKLNHDVEWSDQSHPLRLLTTSYDFIWALSDDLQFSIKNILLLTIAKSLGLPTLLSFFGDQNLLTNKTYFHKYIFNLFDSVSIGLQSTYNKFKIPHIDKWIWAGFPTQTRTQKNESFKNLEKILVIPVFKTFDELDPISNFSDQQIYVDATNMKKINSHIQIKKMWTQYTTLHPHFKKTLLIIEKENLNQILISHHSFIKLNHLEPNPLDLLKWIELSTCFTITPIINESIAVGFFDFWKNNHNCKISIHSKRKHFEDLNSVETPDLIKNKNLLSISIENKMNEINRKIHKLIQNKKAQLSYANMSYRP